MYFDYIYTNIGVTNNDVNGIPMAFQLLRWHNPTNIGITNKLAQFTNLFS